jgi:hypothetical protein
MAEGCRYGGSLFVARRLTGLVGRRRIDRRGTDIRTLHGGFHAQDLHEVTHGTHRFRAPRLRQCAADRADTVHR